MQVSPQSHYRGNETRALLVLAHPLSVSALVLWIANDHVLKARFGNLITGKLSDVAGLIVFPLVLAAVLAWWTKRPMTVALAATAALFASINLLAPADGALEWAMNGFVRSELTQDASDLVLLPLLVVPWQLWRSAAPRPTQLRKAPTQLQKAWSHVVLGVGIMTTLATSSSGGESETFTGTTLLDETQSRIEIPVALTLDDEPADASLAVQVARQTVFFGDGQGEQADALTTEVVDREDESDVVVIELVDVSWGPVEIAWSITAYTAEGEVGNLFNPFDNGTEAQNPVLTVDAPPDSFGPEPLAISDASSERNPDLRFSFIELEITTATQTPELLIGTTSSDSRPPSQITILTEDETVLPRSGVTTRLEPPSRCSADPCTFSIWIRSPRNKVVKLYGAEGVTATMTEHELAKTQEIVQLDPVIVDGRVVLNVPVSVGVDVLPQAPLDQLTTFVQADLYLSPSFDVTESERNNYEQCCGPYQAMTLHEDCCEWDVSEAIGWADRKGPFAIEVYVNLYSLPTVDRPELTVVVGEVTTTPR